MTTQKIIGHCVCPVCGHADAEVKTDKNGRAYIHCKHSCSWQGITRTDHQSGKLKERMRPVTVTVTEPVQKEQPAPVTVKKPADTVQNPISKPVQKPEQEAIKPAAKSGWFQPLIGKGA